MPCLLLQICQNVCFVICLLMCLVGGTVALADEIQLPGDKRFPIIGTIRCSFWPRCVAYSPDGKILVAGGRSSNDIFLWNSETLEKIAELKGHSSSVNALAFSLDGKILASASDDTTVKLWDMKTRQAVGAIERHEEPVECLSFSSDGRKLATAGIDRTTKVWDLMTRQLMHEFKRPTRRGGTRSYFLAAGKSMATIDNNSIICWDIETSKSLLVLAGPYEHKGERIDERFSRRDAIFGLALSADGKKIGAGGLDGTLVCWGLPGGNEIFRAPASTMYTVAFSPNSKYLAAEGPGHNVHLWETTSGRLVGKLDGARVEILTLGFSPDSNALAAGSGDATIVLWDVRGLVVR